MKDLYMFSKFIVEKCPHEYICHLTFIDQMIPSESKQKDEEENSWDLESDRETVSQKDVCLPKATPQKEFHTISGKLEDQMIPSESKQKDEEENSWDLESDRETVSQKDVCLPKATPQKEFHTISGKLEGKNHFLFKESFDQIFL
ncbi:ankyrin repeat domain-containing protein 30A-like [Macaca nemestrina]|uniref:ankyrin repeat domain-containing protein 30A-like n=1 Tax=Macaca nemestrina TaxID=9545 RepID=UPI0039B8E500